MNAITATAAPEQAMTHGVALVPPDQRAAHYARIIAEHDADRTRERRRQRGRAVLIGALVASNIALAGALIVALPLKELRPVFVTLNGDGTFTTSTVQRDVPVSLRDATIKSSLWLYVRARESYSSAAHREDQSIVFMLSDRTVGDAYQASVTQRNPDAPWRRYGTRTTIRIERISEGFLCARDNCASRMPDAYQVRFRRITQTEGQREASVQHVATVRFYQADAIPSWQRVTYNPMGLQVVEYTSTEEGAGR